MPLITRAGRNVDWIEGHLRVPEGIGGGELMVLAPYMREDIYAIYNNLGDGRPTPPLAIDECADPADFEECDLPALMLALERRRAKGGLEARQLDKMLAEPRPMQRVARFAAYCCQCAALELQLSQPPPCHVNFPDEPRQGEERAAKLLRRMLRAGVSKYHPDPEAALAAVR